MAITNTKQPPKARYWLLTLHDPNWNPPQELKTLWQWVRGQKEIGNSTGAIHWQIFVSYKKAVRLRQIKTDFGNSVHAEPSRSSAAEEYVFKEETRVEGTQFELGEKAFQRNNAEDWSRIWEKAKKGQINDIADEMPNVAIQHYRTLKMIAMDFMECPPDLTVTAGIWIHGPPGVGKSFYARQCYGTNLYLKAQNKWWDGYQGQQNVLLDDLDSDCLGHYLKIWADKYAFTAECKGSSVQIRPKNFIVTSNYTIDELFAKDQTLIEAIKRRFYRIFIPFKRG